MKTEYRTWTISWVPASEKRPAHYEARKPGLQILVAPTRVEIERDIDTFIEKFPACLRW